MNREKRVHRPERLKGYDYSRPGCYLITLTTKMRGENILCSVEAEKEAAPPVGPAPLGEPSSQPAPQPVPIVRLTPAGEVVQELIARIPVVYRDACVDCCAVMPDHVHLLLWLGKSSLGRMEVFGNDEQRACLEGGNGPARGPGPTAIPKIVSAIKSLTTRKLGESIWQDHYYDHIIRSRQELESTRQYIQNNPAQWIMDHPLP